MNPPHPSSLQLSLTFGLALQTFLDDCISETLRDVWLSGIGVTTQPQDPGFEPQFRQKCWANPAVHTVLSRLAAVVCCCSDGWL